MFYKKDSEFKEKGVGTLHLKRTTEGKTQMIIRADTNLGKDHRTSTLIHNMSGPSKLGYSGWFWVLQL